MASSHRPIDAVEIPSDDDGDGGVESHLLSSSPNRRATPINHRREEPPPHILVLDDDDDPTPQKNNTKPSFDHSTLFVPETPMPSDPGAFGSGASLVRCTFACSSSSPIKHPPDKLSGLSGLICLESDEEGASPKLFDAKNEEKNCALPCTATNWDAYESEDDLGNHVETGVSGNSLYRSKDGSYFSDANGTAQMEGGDSSLYDYSYNRDASLQVHSDCNYENATSQTVDASRKKRGRRPLDNSDTRTEGDEEQIRKKKLKEEKSRLNEERKRKRQEEKLQKEAMKAEAAEMKKIQKEREKWEKGKLALKSIIAEIDTKVIESGAIGGHLLSRFAEKGLSFRITTNLIERSILWKMIIPAQISQTSVAENEVSYILFIFEAEEFCNLLLNDSLLDHAYRAQKQYPMFTICYVTNKLMSHVNKREQNQYKNPSTTNSWKRPPIEEVLSKLSIYFTRVHSRQCVDESELADHVIGLTSSLAMCQFRKKLTWLSVSANGSLVSKSFIDKKIIKRSVWLKALVAIPKVQPRFAIAISRKYPTMRSLLNVYMDHSKSVSVMAEFEEMHLLCLCCRFHFFFWQVHEKEFLLSDLIIEGELGIEDRRLGEVCSKRVYRILMAQNGFSVTDDVEDGADFF